MLNPVQEHYQRYPYPHYPLLASVRRCDTYALNLDALWSRFNLERPPPNAKKILLAGCGTFAPYPWAVANPDITITALDLSERSLRRARWHCLLHGRHNVVYRCGDLADQDTIPTEFGVIDSYGVLHHMDDPLAGLKALEARLLPGGIMRVMLYNRYARRDEESIRRAFRVLGVDSPRKARRILEKAAAGSRLANFMAVSDEAASLSGLADALLHPRVHTYRIDGLLELIRQTGLELLLFAHHGARETVTDEIERLRSLERDRQAPGNFVLYLGRNINRSDYKTADRLIWLNPCLIPVVGRFIFGSVTVYPRIGCANPPLTACDRSFLRRFITPVSCSELTPDEMEQVAVYRRLLFLI